MARSFWSVLALLVAALGVVFSLFNLQQVTLELGLGRMTLPLGVLILLTLMTGAVGAGLLLWGGVVLPMRLRLRALEKARSTSGNVPSIS